MVHRRTFSEEKIDKKDRSALAQEYHYLCLNMMLWASLPLEQHQLLKGGLLLSEEMEGISGQYHRD
jgi:hypothetical protein